VDEQQQRPAPRKRGFGSMDPEKQRAIASQGGKAAHANGAAHRWTPEEASEKGRLGGLATAQDIEHMRRIASLGGKARKGFQARAKERDSIEKGKEGPCPRS
jgi:general stress protein YciG